jgi:hypothetical protein
MDTDLESWVNASESAEKYRAGTFALSAYARTNADLPVPGPAQTRTS